MTNLLNVFLAPALCVALQAIHSGVDVGATRVLVQDILWLILRSYFSDVIDEDTLPKLGHSSYKADFGIPSMKLIIEAKFAYSKDDFKKIEKAIQEDAVPYLRDIRYETIIVFIYDASASVQEHDVTKGALLQIPGVSGVVIVSRPSQLQNAPG